MLATIMQVLDTTIANVALPCMQGSLGAAQDQITWVLTSYIVASAIMTPGHRLALRPDGAARALHRLGRGLRRHLDALRHGDEPRSRWCVFRTLQGICGAALVPLSQTVLLNINSKEEHGRAMAIWGAGIMVGPIIGPTLGGWLTETFNWRCVFFVNLPVGLLALAGLIVFLPRSPTAAAQLRLLRLRDAVARDRRLAADARPRRAGRLVRLGRDLDLPRADRLRRSGPSCSTSPAASTPSSTRTIFRDSNLVMALVMIFMVGMILLAGLALLPPMLQNVMGYPVVDHRHGAGAARRRHDDLDDRGRAAGRQGRRAAADPDRARADRASRSGR